MSDYSSVAENLCRESIILRAGGVLRHRSCCRIGIERESLRCTASGCLAETGYPETLGDKDDNPYFTADWAESQLELKTPPCPSVLDAYHFLETLTDIALRELAGRDELLWPLSTPCVLPAPERVAAARFREESENIRRRRLREKYPLEMLLLSGIHYNFSFDEALWDAVADGGNVREIRELGYLKTIRNLHRILWFPIGVLGASPVTEAGKTVRVSVRNSPTGYRTLCASRLNYTSVAAYRESVERCLNEGVIAAPSELYTPVRLRFSEGGWEINRLELRILDLNPFEKCGISLSDMEFLRLLFFHCLLSDEAEMEAFAGDPDAVAENGFAPELRQKAQALLNDLKTSAEMMHQEIPGVLTRIEQRLHDPALAYAEQVMQWRDRTGEWLRLANAYREQALKEAWRLPGFDDLELSTQCVIREAIKGGIAFEVLSRGDNMLRLTRGTRREYVVQATKTSLDTYVTPLLMNNKVVSKMLLQERGIRTPGGIELNLDVDDLKSAIAPFIGRRAVVKPVSTNYGIGISVFENPARESQLADAVQLAGRFDRHLLIEEYCPGREFRFLVIAGETFAVTHRRACHVIGDGSSTIHQLIENANRHPWRAPGHHRPLVTIEEDEAMRQFLALRHRDFTSVVPAGEDVPLRRISNISAGGEACDFTDAMPESFKRIAERAAAAFDAVICGVDIIIEEPLRPDGNYAVIEANFNPALLIHEFPAEGKPRPAARRILVALRLLDAMPPEKSSR